MPGLKKSQPMESEIKYFDYKQIKLIESWHKLSVEAMDPYMSFMAEWISFNAICYNLYHESANIERANIDRKKSKLEKIQERLIPSAEIKIDNAKIEGTKDKWSLDLSLPERLFISVSNNYTENVIFNEFVIKNKDWYKQNPSSLFSDLKKSLKKGEDHYVINMAKSKYYDSNNIPEMSNKNIIIFCEENELKTIKNVLYQIRCNIFHGEKTPADLNDDRIVKSALPILRYIVQYLIDKHKIINIVK